MKLQRLTRDYLAKKSRRGLATVTFTRRGVVIISSCALSQLGLEAGGYSGDSFVDIFQGDVPSEFFISRGRSYRIRKNGTGGGVFNSVDLSELVIKNSFMVTTAHFNEKPPERITLVVFNNPVDEEENSHVYALRRKKA